MGKLKYFLGVKIEYFNHKKIWIGQPDYTRNQPMATPIDTGKLVKSNKTDRLVNQEMYQSDIGKLVCLSTRKRPDIAIAVGNVARFSAKPSEQHWIGVKRIMRYLCGTMDYSLLNRENDQ